MQVGLELEVPARLQHLRQDLDLRDRQRREEPLAGRSVVQRLLEAELACSPEEFRRFIGVELEVLRALPQLA